MHAMAHQLSVTCETPACHPRVDKSDLSFQHLAMRFGVLASRVGILCSRFDQSEALTVLV